MAHQPRRRGTPLITPKGPNGERQPADAVSCAVTVACIITGKIEDFGYNQPAKLKGGLAGGMRALRNLALLSEREFHRLRRK